jgi:ketosteroid isomerase-like protein
MHYGHFSSRNRLNAGPMVSFRENMKKISSEDVRQEVQRFWAILSGNITGKLEEMYSSTAIVFTGKAKRSESGKLMALRRSRQLPGPASPSRAEVGSIDVQIVGLDVAIAAYTYSFDAHKTGADGSKVRLTTTFGRATQIFQRSGDGALRIVHEHLSAAAPPTKEKAAE